MTSEEQRIAIAEACGWHHGNWNDQPVDESFWTHDDIEMRRRLGVPSGCLPDYLNDLNAMHEAEKNLYDEHSCYRFWQYTDNLFAIVGSKLGSYTFVNATASQKVEAFLKTLSLWKD